jgi:iron(III) transport system substrate-binding protein
MAWPNIASILSTLVIIPIGFLTAVQEVHGQDTALLQAARAEGQVVFYSSSSIAEMRPLVDAFAAKYPFVKPEFYRAASETLQNKIVTEDRAGASRFDVVQTNPVEIEDLARRGIIGRYESPERKAYSEMNKDRNGYWTNLHSSYYVLGYNPKMVPTASIPRDWNDLLEQRWNGNFAMDPEDYRWYGTMLEYFGEERGKKLMRGLAKQKPIFRKGHSLIAELLAAGEFPAALVYAHRVESMKAKGAPIEWVRTTKPIVAEMRIVGISAKTKRPNAAKLFLDFMLSREGQAVLRSFGRVVARQDLDPLVPALDPSKLALHPALPILPSQLNLMANEFREVFGVR